LERDARSPPMTDTLRIRDLRPDEIPFFAHYAERLFSDTYAESHASMLDPYCAAAFGPAVQHLELSEEGSRVVLAEVEGEPVGYAQLRRRPVPAPGHEGEAMEVARFYVDRRHHGTGIAYRLMDAAVARALAAGARHLWLQAAEYNTRALRFYARVGFREVGRVPFDFAGIRELDHLLALPVPVTHIDDVRG
jgi:GNAT superfamily N-acetyltransferase